MSIDHDEVFNVIARADHALGVKEVMSKLGVHPGAATEMKRTLRDLVRAGRLSKDGKRYRPEGLERPKTPKPGSDAGDPKRSSRPPPPILVRRTSEGTRRRGRGGEVVGVLHKHRDGFGFVERIGSEGADIFVPAIEAAGAFDGDLVKVEVIPGTAGRTQGRLIETVERRRELALGTYISRGASVWVEPTDPLLGPRIDVAANREVNDGDIVRVRLIRPGAAGHVPPTGQVLEKAGEKGDPYLEVLKASFANGFSDEFPKIALEEAEREAVPVSERDVKGRRDVRNLRLVTIDGEDARDFDDAVYVERAPAGYRLVVAIADVAHYVRPGSSLDDEALRRTTSVYFPNAVLPMLPEALSNGTCSLKPDEDRLCMVADMLISRAGQPVEAEIYEGVMRSRARCTYTEVADLLDGKAVPSREFLRNDLTLAWELAQKLTAMRSERGSIDFDIPEAKVILDDADKPIRVEKRERNAAHRLIEECMLAANEAVARHFTQRGLPTLYRIHASPDEEKLEAFATLARAHGVDVPFGALTPLALNEILKKVSKLPQQRAFNSLLLRAMMQASYHPDNVGHYGLAAEEYLHFTSPIRRYPDLVVHRLLKQAWSQGEQALMNDETTERLTAIGLRCSERERAAMKAERDVDAFFGALFLKDRVGDRFVGVIASVVEFGLFVELQGVFVEGLVKSEDLGHVHFDPDTQTLATHAGKTWSVGDAVEVEVRSVNLERRQVDLALLEEGKEMGDGTVRRRSLSEAVDLWKAKGKHLQARSTPGRGAARGHPGGRSEETKAGKGKEGRGGRSSSSRGPRGSGGGSGRRR
jgi:ribonuclease R